MKHNIVLRKIDHRLSVGFEDATLARVNRLTNRIAWLGGPLDLGQLIAGSACDDRQCLLRRLIDETTRALEEAVESMSTKDAHGLLRSFRVVVAKGKPRAQCNLEADASAVEALLAELAVQSTPE